MSASGHADAAIADKQLASAVAKHKAMFFAEKDIDKQLIDYKAAVNNRLQIVPEGRPLDALERDYAAMLADGLLSKQPPGVRDVINICAELQARINL